MQPTAPATAVAVHSNTLSGGDFPMPRCREQHSRQLASCALAMCARSAGLLTWTSCFCYTASRA